MFRKLLCAALVSTALLAGPSVAAEKNYEYPRQLDWSFNGPLGTFDRAALQRGFQVYKEVCSACHSLRLLSYRNLEWIGFSEEEVAAIARQYTVMDGPNDEGEMFERAALPSDRFRSPFANEEQARFANNGAYPLDLSVITKARKDGSNYLYSLLTGYEETPPEGFMLGEGMYYNRYFDGRQIAMAPPLVVDDQVTYTDGTAATVDQMARDITTFLTWAGEPHMEERKETGVKVMIFLAVFTLMMYFVKRRVWANLH
jgi:ubiquinol-cytochrome c reductase cytochrome c1 subunit